MSVSKKHFSKADIVFSIVLIAVLALSVWKLSYGFGWYDEAFYITLPHRAVLGDAFIADEWHPAQLFGFLTTPLVAAYKFICGDLTGVMLYMRVVYLVLHVLNGIVVYCFVRKKFGVCGAFAAGSFMLFTPFDIMAPSYNTLAVGLLTFASVGAAVTDENKPYLYVCFGAAYAGSVLCCPYLAVIFPLILLFGTLYGEEKKYPYRRCVLFFTLGVIMLAGVFAVFEIRRAGVKEILDNFPELFRDAEHPPESVLLKLSRYLNHAPHYFGYGVIAFIIILVGAFSDKKRTEHAGIWFVLSCCPALFSYAFSFANLNEYYNALMAPLFYPGIMAYICLRDRPKKFFFCVTLTGLFYSICVCLASNVGFHAVSLGYCVANTASWIFIGLLVRQIKANVVCNQRKKWLFTVLPIVAACGLFSCLLTLQVVTKATHVFFDASPKELTATIKTGPAKGIKTTPSNAGVYKAVRTDIELIRAESPKNALILSQKTWCSLMLPDVGYACYSAWLSGVNKETIKRLEHYYYLHPDKIPEEIYAEKPYYAGKEVLFEQAGHYGYTVTETKTGYILRKEKR